MHVGCTRSVGRLGLLSMSPFGKYEPLGPSVPFGLSTLHAIVRPSVLSFPASMPRYAMLASSEPEGQVKLPPAGLVTVLPFSFVWLSMVLGVAVAAPRVRVQEEVDATCPLSDDEIGEAGSPVITRMIASTTS
ncbi:hypothetical protein EXS65_01630 [Candidatus Peribacteria bacterium]|nr:hypothetical protein [Candidatus Peribacteria bacterium]